MPDAKKTVADVQGNAGLVEARVRRETGRLVSVYRSREQDLDEGFPGHETPYYTVCEDHGQCVGHRSLYLALRHATNPKGWCEVCSGSFEALPEVLKGEQP